MNATKPNEKTFRSRVGVLPVLLTAALLSPAIVSAVRHGAGHPAVYTVGGMVLLIALVLTGIRYTVAGDRLTVKMWSMSIGGVRIADIRSVRRSYNPLSSPAVSLRRLRVQCRKETDWLLVSPADEKGFIEALKSVNPHIAVSVPPRGAAWRIWDWDI
ncbi:MAG: PH domain-containing protein [Alistipes sp.]|jgi:hypothetical protein|nr:PH domain-containing protein [Alistipes sp.]